MTFGGFQEAQLIGGEAGLDRRIEWVRIMETPDTAAALAALRKAALADDTGAALNVAVRDIRPLPQAAE